MPRGSVTAGTRTRRAGSGAAARHSKKRTPASPRDSVSAMMCACDTATKSAASKNSPTAIWWAIAQRRGLPNSPASIAFSSSFSRINETLIRSDYRLAKGGPAYDRTSFRVALSRVRGVADRRGPAAPFGQDAGGALHRGDHRRNRRRAKPAGQSSRNRNHRAELTKRSRRGDRDSAGEEIVDLRLSEPGLAQDLARMLAEPRRRVPHGTIGPAEPHRRPHHPYRPLRRMLGARKEGDGGEVIVGRQFGKRVDRTARDVGGSELVE